MKISLDRQSDTAYIKISSKPISQTVSVTESCNIDLDKDGQVVGIELLFISSVMDDFKLWLDLNSAAEYLDKAPITIRRWIRERRLPYYKPGKQYLFLKKDLDEFVDRGRSKP